MSLTQICPFGPKQGKSPDFSPICFVLQLRDCCFSGFLYVWLFFCSTFVSFSVALPPDWLTLWVSLITAMDIFNNCLTISSSSPKCLPSPRVFSCSVIMAIVIKKTKNGLGKHPRAAAVMVPWGGPAGAVGGERIPVHERDAAARPLLLSPPRLQHQPPNEVLTGLLVPVPVGAADGICAVGPGRVTAPHPAS